MISNPPTVDGLFAGRYRIEARLARGGMGEVFRAENLATGERIALKRLLPDQDREVIARMFEREYHTLAGLAHPRIIEVYEYGLSGGLPYYTMELLDGKDLRELSPLSYRVACRHLHDVASSLALLHARRLLHRDLSPRNVRVTQDGRSKLIDFGALTSFGPCETVVGTPPLVPPEALHCAALDQRADLYSLGALAYYLLTGCHAFAVKEVTELPAAWQIAPRRPSEMLAARKSDVLSEPIPAALDELVMSLLTLDPLGRPATAAEVMDRLAAIGSFEPEGEGLSSQSYLRSPALVGREQELLRLEKRLRGAREQRASSVLLQATPGMGSSRLLGEVALRAQLAGITPLLIDAKLHRGAYGVVHDLIDKTLHAARSDVADAALAHGPALARFSPKLASELAIAPDHTDLSRQPGELRRQTQHALLQWLLSLSERRPLCLLIDNFHYADEGSVALLGSLARAAALRPLGLCLVLAHQANATRRPDDRLLGALGSSVTPMTLHPLSLEDMRTLVRSLFGDVPHTTKLADWLHGVAGGSPQASMSIVRHLLDSGVVRYVSGIWVLPAKLAPEQLPQSLSQVIATRLNRLSEPAKRVARALSVRPGPQPIGLCLAIAKMEGIQDAYEAIEELVREDVLSVAGDRYHFCHDAVSERLQAELQPEHMERLHKALGALFLPDVQHDTQAMLDAGWHLLRGGEEGQGADLLAEAGLLLSKHNDEMQRAVAPLFAALEVFRKQGRNPYELLEVLGPLILAAYSYDRRIAKELGDETIALFKQVLGLNRAAKLRPWLGKHLSLYLGLLSAVPGFLAKGRGGLKGFADRVSMFGGCLLSVVGSALVSYDRQRVPEILKELEPLSALGKDHATALVYRFMSDLSKSVLQERVAEAIASFEGLVARVEGPRPITGLPAESRAILLGGLYAALGQLEAYCAGHRALGRAERLERLGIRTYAMNAAQIRVNYHACRGEFELARQHREQVEILATQSGSGWQLESWSPCMIMVPQLMCRDRHGLRHTTETLDRLSASTPQLKRFAVLARAAYCAVKGDYPQAEAIRRSELASVAPRGVGGWFNLLVGHAHCVRKLGDPALAKQMLLDASALIEPADHQTVLFMYEIPIELALAQADLLELDDAVRTLDAALLQYGDCENPLVLGNLHCAGVQVAIKAGDLDAARRHLAEMNRHFRPTGNPALIAQCEQLTRELQRGAVEEPGSAVDVSSSVTIQHTPQTDTGGLFANCHAPQERADRALSLLLEHMDGSKGYLFGFDGSLHLISPGSASDVPADLEAQVLAAIADFSAESTVVVDTISMQRAGSIGSAALQAPTYRLLVLSKQPEGSEEDERVVGAAAIAQRPSRLRAPSPKLLQAIASAISEQSTSM